MKDKPKLRKGVCGIFLSEKGEFLLGERLKNPGQWQLPQGGIEKNESPLEALYREMEEEVGVTELRILRDSGEFISYQWPSNLFANSKYQGQEHIYFLLDGSEINTKKLKATDEFANFAWFTPKEVLKEIVDWKKQAYERAFEILKLKL